MKTKNVLIIDEDLRAIAGMQAILDEAKIPFQVCSSTAEGWDIVRTSPQISHVLVRMMASRIDGIEFCRKVREVKSCFQKSILVIVSEEQLGSAGNALDAGASDVLIEPFEPRELRMRLNIDHTAHHRRVDEPHAAISGRDQAESPPGLLPEEKETSISGRSSNLIVPRLDPVSFRFAYGVSEMQIESWKDDESVVKLALDQVLVCPCCKAIPTFRPGCGVCGSAWTERESLIHHYACAHIGAESEFRNNDELSCPKCLKKDLVAGADFEIVGGGCVCSDCGAKSSDSQLVGHCLSCDHRFPAYEASLIQLTGLRVHDAHEAGRVVSPKARAPRATLEETSRR